MAEQVKAQLCLGGTRSFLCNLLSKYGLLMHVIPEQAELLRVSAYFLDYAAWRMGRSTEVRYKRKTLCKAQHGEGLGHKVTAGHVHA